MLERAGIDSRGVRQQEIHLDAGDGLQNFQAACDGAK
jgi:hypothetical protein